MTLFDLIVLDRARWRRDLLLAGGTQIAGLSTLSGRLPSQLNQRYGLLRGSYLPD
jgi:hypothetical protein